MAARCLLCRGTAAGAGRAAVPGLAMYATAAATPIGCIGDGLQLFMGERHSTTNDSSMELHTSSTSTASASSSLFKSSENLAHKTWKISSSMSSFSNKYSSRTISPIPTRSSLSLLSRTFSSSTTTKSTTNIVGLEVLPKPRESLMSIYSSILREIQAVPQDAMYRKQVELMTSHRMQVVADNEDVAQIEEIIGMGQVEELYEQAKRERDLIPKMVEWKPWIIPDGKEIEVTVMDEKKEES